MILKVFSIYDIKAEVYNTPFFFSTNGQAMRAFKDLVNDRNSTINRHPDDYKLCCIGKFDDATAVLVDNDAESLGFGSDYLDKPSDVNVKSLKVS